jgi:replication factor C small subunit
MMAKELWTEKYRPKTIDGYVFKDPSQRRQIESWIKDKSIPHLMLSGGPGIGKTTLAKILLNEIGIEGFDILEINASRDNGVDFLKDTVISFVSMIPFGPFKVVLLDEADYLTHNTQAILRGIMEEYAAHARFILTCNSPNKIMPAIHSRCQQMHFSSIDQTEFTARAATILVEEGIEFDLDTLDLYVKLTYPDLRKCINFLSQNVQNSRLITPNSEDSGIADYKIQMVSLFKAGDIKGARTLLCASARPEEIEGIFTWMYHNLDMFGKTEEQKDSALLVIKQALVDHAVIRDPEINLSACLIKLARLQ